MIWASSGPLREPLVGLLGRLGGLSCERGGVLGPLLGPSSRPSWTILGELGGNLEPPLGSSWTL
eukprot:1416047-Pyramimonas_sp.AAC.1